jgi:hypothetical protein
MLAYEVALKEKFLSLAQTIKPPHFDGILADISGAAPDAFTSQSKVSEFQLKFNHFLTQSTRYFLEQVKKQHCLTTFMMSFKLSSQRVSHHQTLFSPTQQFEWT